MGCLGWRREEEQENEVGGDRQEVRSGHAPLEGNNGQRDEHKKKKKRIKH